MRANGDVVQAIRQNLCLCPDDESGDGVIAAMTHREQLERYLMWNNVIGYSGLIIAAIKEIYGVELKD